MKQRSRIIDVGLALLFAVVLAATVLAALQPGNLEQYNPQDTGTGLRLKMNRNQDRIGLASEQQRITIDTNAIQRFDVTVNDVDTVTLPRPYIDSDFQPLITPMVWYGSAPTSGYTTLAITDSSFVVNMGGTDDTTRIHVIAAGSMLGRE